MRVILTKSVKKWLDKEKNVRNENIVEAAEEVVLGSFEANLGGNLYKKRISNSTNKGKSSGSRLIVAFKHGDRFFVLHVFNKNESENISSKEKAILIQRAKQYFQLDEEQLSKAMKAKVLFEIKKDN